MTMTTKVCSKCKKSLPRNIDYFYKDRSRKDGFTHSCKQCRKGKYTNHILLRELHESGYKICIKCKTKHLSTPEFFSRDKSRKDNLRIICKECERLEHQIYIKNNKLNISKYNQEYHKKNPDKALIRKHKRRSKMKDLDYTFTKEEWDTCKEYFNYQCAYCGCTPDTLTQDHFIALNNGGSYTKDNIIPCCFSCNSSKQDSTFDKWYKGRDFYDTKKVKKIEEYLKTMIDKEEVV